MIHESRNDADDNINGLLSVKEMECEILQSLITKTSSLLSSPHPHMKPNHSHSHSQALSQIHPIHLMIPGLRKTKNHHHQSLPQPTGGHLGSSKHPIIPLSQSSIGRCLDFLFRYQYLFCYVVDRYITEQLLLIFSKLGSLVYLDGKRGKKKKKKKNFIEFLKI